MPLIIVVVIILITLVVFVINSNKTKVTTPPKQSEYFSGKFNATFTGPTPNFPQELPFYTKNSRPLNQTEAVEIAKKFDLAVKPTTAASGYGELVYIFQNGTRRLKINTFTRRVEFNHQAITSFKEFSLSQINMESKKQQAKKILTDFNLISPLAGSDPQITLGLQDAGFVKDEVLKDGQNYNRIIYIKFDFGEKIDNYPIIGFSPDLTFNSITLPIDSDQPLRINSPLNAQNWQKDSTIKLISIDQVLRKIEKGEGFIQELTSTEAPPSNFEPHVLFKNLEGALAIQSTQFDKVEVVYVLPFKAGDPLVPNYLFSGTALLKNNVSWKIKILIPVN